MHASHPSRRSLIKVAVSAAGGLALGFPLGPARAQRPAGKQRPPPEPPALHEIGAWILIGTDESVTIRIARAEMGQGILTALAQLAAEELDCAWSRVSTELAEPGASMRDPRASEDFATSNSRSVRATQAAIREAGATARYLLMQAAADAWKVPRGELSTDEGRVHHAPTGRSISYGRLAAAAARLEPPPKGFVTLKPRSAWRFVGQPLTSLDLRAKLTGAAVYGIDVRLPGMLSAAIRSTPVAGGKLTRFEAGAAASMPGVRSIVAVGDDAVAVVADTWWQASQALARVEVEWAPAPADGISSESIDAYLSAGLETQDAFVGRTHGDALEALRGAAQTLEAVYTTPFLHHATLEPQNATAVWRPDRVEVWAGTQNAEATLRLAAEAAGLPLEQASINRTLIGGGFGRRLRQDVVRQAVLIARQFPGTPVKLIWSREEDTTHGHYRPVTQARLRGSLDAKGEATGLILRISGQSILTSNLARSQPTPGKPGRDPRMFQGLHAEPGEAQMGYSIPNLYIDHAMRNTLVPVGSWRGVHTTQNGVYLECFIDEMAHAARRDPLEFRRGLMKGHPHHMAVLTAVAAKAGWEEPPPPGVHRGLAQMMSVGSYSATVAEVSASEAGAIRVQRIVIALDCGNVVNPRLVEAQLEGSAAMALSATLHEEITIRSGRVVEQNFDAYRVLHLADMPRIETVLVPSGDFWGGVGEAAMGSIAPAVLNAIFAATGQRVRSLPVRAASLR